MKIVLASSNSGKIKEFNALLKDLNIDVIPQSEFGIKDAEETGLTFIENAMIKARHAAAQSGLPALADDSGLCVSALLGAPGIYSARYAGKEANAKANIQKLLTELSDVPPEKRNAAFHCALVFMLHAKDPTPLVCEGRWEGMIGNKPSGQEGFGYDPIFYVASEKKTASELPPALKNRLSHRYQALQQLLKRLPEKINIG